ncbi:MAG: arginine deiminase-related protein [Ferruginibacter sp.]
MQNTSHLLMIEPVNFGFNAETAVNNPFQVNTNKNVQQEALKEFNDLVKLLRENKMDVTVIKDTAEPFTPDSIFPNNWISFHEDGAVFLYPMYASNRRKERKLHILENLQTYFHVSKINDLSQHEAENIFLEGTGSMVLDRGNRIVYACISPRTDARILNEFCRISNYSAVMFSSKDINAVDIYHTNVMMCIAASFAVICLESIADKTERATVIGHLNKSHKEIIDISLQQLNSFAGNMLQVKNADNELLLVMSTQAYRSLTKEQVQKLEQYNKLVHSPLDTIESAGGGSARCMMAEIFNKPK